MDAIRLHAEVVSNYKEYLRSFVQIRDSRIRTAVENAFADDHFLPEPLIQFNPSFDQDVSLAQLGREGLAHPDLQNVFGDFQLFTHQIEALRTGFQGNGFIVTSGTGSGKSLTYLGTIFNSLLRTSDRVPGVRAILVYPMNALINSQEEEIMKYEINYLRASTPAGLWLDPAKEHSLSIADRLAHYRKVSSDSFPIAYAKYTGQENQEARELIRQQKPDILLTNYMMLELIMTRASDSWLRGLLKDHLRYLVLDELHTYRGRQGADVSLLVRRLRLHAQNELICIGTSATMVTEGGPEQRKSRVAEVASLVFGGSYGPEQVIEEKLKTYTDPTAVLPSRLQLQEAVHQSPRLGEDADVFLVHPLTLWLERKVALIEEAGVLRRGKPLSLSQMADLLSKDCGEPQAECRRALEGHLSWVERINRHAAEQGKRDTVLPFKLHQFISQTGMVYVTLDSKETRHIELKTERYVKQDTVSRLLYPLLFSRISGFEFICVTKDYANHRLDPRDPDGELPPSARKEDFKGNRKLGLAARSVRPEDFPYGYLLVPDGPHDDLWQEDLTDNLPREWFKDNGEPENYYRYQLPTRIWFDREGNFSDSERPDMPFQGWYMPVKLLFDPSSGMIFNRQTKESTKLMRIGNEGRSTATTQMVYAVIDQLQEQGVSARLQKMLSFTDNRQDASLQAGHFNDFIHTGMIRSAVYQALKDAPGNRLDIDYIADRVLAQLGLRERDYVKEEHVSGNDAWPDPGNEEAVKKFLQLRILYDLKNGWRYNLPNLEATGLLRIAYKRLEEYSAKDDFFREDFLLSRMTPDQRTAFFANILNYFRTSYALEYPLLDSDADIAETAMKARLDPDKPWSLDQEESIARAAWVAVRRPGQLYRTSVVSIGPRSYLGRYIRRISKEFGHEFAKEDDLMLYMEGLCRLLRMGHFLSQRELVSGADPVIGYRLKVVQLEWVLGDGDAMPYDEVRLQSFREIRIRPNPFFKRFYQSRFSRFGRTLIGREHTGQISNADRQDREKKFRQGEIAALYCSPTMELGIDIAELNIVHLRNVPPTPANYAQRSGRSGRSGQTALVFTYCSQTSPHDRTFFKEPARMVAGVVAAPRLDLTNEDLCISHLQAYVLMQCGIGELQTSVDDVLDISDIVALPLKAEVAERIRQQIASHGRAWAEEYFLLLRDWVPGIAEASWFSRQWCLGKVEKFPDRFNQAFERWRVLYQAAETMIREAGDIISNPTIKKDNPQLPEAKRMQAIGLKKRYLLRNESGKSFGEHSEFYVFRYLASEGFLPGYNFPRLPVRVFVGKRGSDEGQYISRGRFIALKEFGPSNVIYHNGAKYRVDQLTLDQAILQTENFKASKETGYAFLGAEVDQYTNDPITGHPLTGEAIEVLPNVLPLSESNASPQERITSEEEERLSMGYDLGQYFSYSENGVRNLKALIKEGDEPLMQVIYGPATRLMQVNKRWKRSRDQDQGFLIHSGNGRWLRIAEAEKLQEQGVNVSRVQLYTTDHADSLLIQPLEQLGMAAGGVCTLAFALKQAIERRFQVEESEIGLWLMGAGEAPQILFYEATEGTLGVLRRLVNQPSLFHDLFAEACRVCHFDPETFEDLRPDLPEASYEDLLSYRNQRYHPQIDRFLIQTALGRLSACSVQALQDGLDRDAHYRKLLDACDPASATERTFVHFLYRKGYALPDRAQVNVPGCYVNADFVFDLPDGPVLIFCDGSVHDSPAQMAEDRQKRQCLSDAGYHYVVWHHTTLLETLVDAFSHIFRKI